MKVAQKQRGGKFSLSLSLFLAYMTMMMLSEQQNSHGREQREREEEKGENYCIGADMRTSEREIVCVGWPGEENSQSAEKERERKPFQNTLFRMMSMKNGIEEFIVNENFHFTLCAERPTPIECFFAICIYAHGHRSHVLVSERGRERERVVFC
jgi:hypothetical protein